MRETPRDRISNLPDSLLHHILSFLHIIHGAQTSVLSKRWNYIWTTIPTLEFWSLAYKVIPSSYYMDMFMDFVDGTLHRHNTSNIDKFELHCDHYLSERRVHSWVSTVIRGNVKDLSLKLSQDHPLFIPLSLFTCESLTSLDLWAHPNIRFPKYMSFPRLKCLTLHLFKFTYECWNEELFSNSHVLEELILDHCSVSMSSFCISIPTLKVLKIDNWNNDGDGFGDCILKIDAPRLVTFSYTGPVAKEFILSSFLALEEATVSINVEENDAVQTSRLLRALAHVKYLSVCNLTLKVVYSDYDRSNNLPTFHNVKKLILSKLVSTEQGLIGLLKAVPNLESLSFEECMFDEEEEYGDNVDGVDANRNGDADYVEGGNNHINHEEVVSNSAEPDDNDQGDGSYDKEDDSWALDIASKERLFLPLKSVYFEQFAGNPREIRWVKLILRFAKALQMMSICYVECDFYFKNVKTEKELKAEIPSFRRASPGCVLDVCRD